MKHLPRKRFGQNFLEDQFVIDQIIASLNLKKNDFVVEIGPGLGALTMPLLRVLEHLNVVEIDRDLVARLQNNVAAKKINIIEADALSFDFSALLAESNAEKTPKQASSSASVSLGNKLAFFVRNINRSNKSRRVNFPLDASGSFCKVKVIILLRRFLSCALSK